jgi:ABC-2 type transport system permease protein
MSTTIAPVTFTETTDAPGARTAGDGDVTLARATRSEWIKFRSLRSSWYTLGGAFAALVVFGLIIGYNTNNNWSTLAPEDAAASGPLQGHYLAQLLMGVLGVLFVSGEYSTGMIRSTIAAVPKRVPVVLAKAIVFGAVALVTMMVGSLLAFGGAQLFLSPDGHGSGLFDAGVLRVVLGTGLYLALVGLFGSALGWILRSTPAGISVYVAFLLVIPVLIQVFPGNWPDDVARLMPGQAGEAFITSVNTDNLLSPGVGLAVLVAWVVGALGVAVVLLRRRDA